MFCKELLSQSHVSFRPVTHWLPLQHCLKACREKNLAEMVALSKIPGINYTLPPEDVYEKAGLWTWYILPWWVKQSNKRSLNHQYWFKVTQVLDYCGRRGICGARAGSGRLQSDLNCVKFSVCVNRTTRNIFDFAMARLAGSFYIPNVDPLVVKLINTAQKKSFKAGPVILFTYLRIENCPFNRYWQFRLVPRTESLLDGQPMVDLKQRWVPKSYSRW